MTSLDRSSDSVLMVLVLLLLLATTTTHGAKIVQGWNYELGSTAPLVHQVFPDANGITQVELTVDIARVVVGGTNGGANQFSAKAHPNGGSVNYFLPLSPSTTRERTGIMPTCTEAQRSTWSKFVLLEGMGHGFVPSF